MLNSRVADSPGRRWPAAKSVALLLSVVLVVSLADAAFRDRGDFDYTLMRAICRLDAPGLEQVMRFVSHLTGSFWAITLWTVVLGTFLVFRRWLEAAVMVAFPFAGGVNSLIRAAVGRSRPDLSRLDFDRFEAGAQFNDFVSFPSGHVVGAVLLYGFLFILAGGIRFAPARYFVRAAAVAVIALAGIARVWLGAHWVGDVITAYALGGLSLLLVAVM